MCVGNVSFLLRVVCLVGVYSSQLSVLAQKATGEGECEAAVAAFRSGQFERAATSARQCIERGEGNSATHKVLALSSYLLNRIEDYQANMEKTIALNPQDGEAEYHLGRFFYETKRYKDAMSRFRRAIDLDSENYKAYYYSALCRQGNSDETGAVEDYRKAIEIIERKRINYGWPFADLGDLLILQGNYESGLSWIYRGVRNDPALPYTHYAYASALLKKEASFEVEQELKRAIRLDPGYASAYYLLGRYYTKIGDKEQAKSVFAKFEELRQNPLPSPFGLRR